MEFRPTEPGKKRRNYAKTAYLTTIYYMVDIRRRLDVTTASSQSKTSCKGV